MKIAPAISEIRVSFHFIYFSFFFIFSKIVIKHKCVIQKSGKSKSLSIHDYFTDHLLFVV